MTLAVVGSMGRCATPWPAHPQIGIRMALGRCHRRRGCSRRSLRLALIAGDRRRRVAARARSSRAALRCRDLDAVALAVRRSCSRRGLAGGVSAGAARHSRDPARRAARRLIPSALVPATCRRVERRNRSAAALPRAEANRATVSARRQQRRPMALIAAATSPRFAGGQNGSRRRSSASGSVASTPTRWTLNRFGTTKAGCRRTARASVAPASVIRCVVACCPAVARLECGSNGLQRALGGRRHGCICYAVESR